MAIEISPLSGIHRNIAADGNLFRSRKRRLSSGLVRLPHSCGAAVEQVDPPSEGVSAQSFRSKAQRDWIVRARLRVRRFVLANGAHKEDLRQSSIATPLLPGGAAACAAGRVSMRLIISGRLPFIEGDWHEFEVKKNTKRARRPDGDDQITISKK